MGFVIREANSSDINLIFDFICDLADYEKLRHDVTATPEILHESIFVKKQAEVLIAELDGVPVGFALYFHNFSTFKGKACLYLEDIFIKPQYRGKGFGKAIFNRLAQIAVERGCDRFDWAVLDWNEPSINFYKSLGAFPMDDWTVFRLTGDALKNVARMEK
ncbi:MAG: GNAT family N-acetyltransferase [Bacteroidales bacterium]|nr:GNAT family N-acetyltransferase [Bacteroidales bacterium]